MDKEGLDLAILFPTSAMYVTAFSPMDPRFAAAACRAYNDGSTTTSRPPIRDACSAPPRSRPTM